MKYPRIKARRLTGNEPLHNAGRPAGPTLLDFWRWSGSNLVSNTFRGWLAEFIVASAIGQAAACVRPEFEAWDLTTDDGRRVEVKSSAYIQHWAQERYSIPRFSIRPALAWDPDTDEWGEQKERHADVYVFCLLAHRDQATLDPLDLSQWTFYVLPAAALAPLGDQKSIGITGIERLGAVEVGYAGLKSAVESLGNP